MPSAALPRCWFQRQKACPRDKISSPTRYIAQLSTAREHRRTRKKSLSLSPSRATHSLGSQRAWSRLRDSRSTTRPPALAASAEILLTRISLSLLPQMGFRVPMLEVPPLLKATAQPLLQPTQPARRGLLQMDSIRAQTPLTPFKGAVNRGGGVLTFLILYYQINPDEFA